MCADASLGKAAVGGLEEYDSELWASWYCELSIIIMIRLTRFGEYRCDVHALIMLMIARLFQTAVAP